MPNRRLQTKTVVDVLNDLDNKHAAVGMGVARGGYAFWLGSGLSKDVVPGVRDLLKMVFEFLQRQVAAGDNSCPYRNALEKIVSISEIQDLGPIDFEQPMDSWIDLERLLDQLEGKYSAVLDVAVTDEMEEDFLLWHAIRPVDTYANPTLEPDSGHLCIAILMLEGAISSAVTTNWDGLVETALGQLYDNPSDLLGVKVHKDEFRENLSSSIELIKFHGCAVLAGSDPDRYRPLLIGRASQVSNWTQNPENNLALANLTTLVATSPTLFIGLSGQDADIHAILTEAVAQLSWPWPSEPAAAVFALEELKYTQDHILKLVYGRSYTANRPAIEESALLGVYAQPLLIALVLFTLAEKLSAFIGNQPHERWTAADILSLQSGIRNIRDLLGNVPDNTSVGFTRNFIGVVSLVLRVFRKGEPPSPGSPRYEPLTALPNTIDPNIDHDPLRNLAVVASLLGRGSGEGLWELTAGDTSHPESGVCTVDSDHAGHTKLFLVKDDQVLANLEAAGVVDLNDPDVLAVHAMPIPERQRRNPSQALGRNGAPSGKELSMETLIGEALDATDLYERFRQQAAI